MTKIHLLSAKTTYKYYKVLFIITIKNQNENVSNHKSVLKETKQKGKKR